jgi:hypothetical protein
MSYWLVEKSANCLAFAIPKMGRFCLTSVRYRILRDWKRFSLVSWLNTSELTLGYLLFGFHSVVIVVSDMNDELATLLVQGLGQSCQLIYLDCATNFCYSIVRMEVGYFSCGNCKCSCSTRRSRVLALSSTCSTCSCVLKTPQPSLVVLNSSVSVRNRSDLEQEGHPIAVWRGCCLQF